MKKYQELEQKIEELQQEVNRLKKEEQENQLPKGFSLKWTLKVLENPKANYQHLLNAFDWNGTPQRPSYWHKIELGNNQLTDQDIIQLQKWVILYYQQK